MSLPLRFVMLRQDLSCIFGIPRSVNLVQLRRPLVCQKVGFNLPLCKSSKNQRINSLVMHKVNHRKFFHADVALRSLNDQDIKNHIDGITDKFMEAMELLSDAVSSKGTVYFSEDMVDAEVLIDEVLKDYERLLGLLSDDQARNVVRSIGLKMEELKAQLQMLKESVKD